MKEIKQINVYEFDERFYQKIVNGQIKYAPSTTYKLSVASPSEYGLTQWRGDVGNKRADEILEEAGTFGSHIHEMISKLIRGHNVHSDELRIFNSKQSLKALRCIHGFIEWAKEYQPIFMNNEFVTWCDEYNFAGTVDLLCQINGHDYIVDFKTSNSVHAQHKRQVAAYGYSEGIQNVALLHLGNSTKKGWSFLPFSRDQYMQEFVAISNVFETLHPEAKPHLEQFPEFFTLENIYDNKN